MILKTLSKFLFFLSLVMFIPLGFSFYVKEQKSQIAFGLTILITISVSIILFLKNKKSKSELYRQESILLLMLLWILTAFFSSFPFIFSKTLSPLDSYFEAMSGLTTTGSTMMCPKLFDPVTKMEVPIRYTNYHVPTKTYIFFGTIDPIRDENGLILRSGIEAVDQSILLWRSLLQWIGGIGIVVIFLTILPAIGVGGKFLYQMEMTGPIKNEFSPKVKDATSRIWKLYIAMTVVEVLLLKIFNLNLPFFDAINIALTNVSTGGFSIKNDGIASYNSLSIHWIVFAFMILGSINFSLYFHILKRKFSKLLVPDFFLFLIVALIGSILVSCFLIEELGFKQAIVQGTFQAISMQTTTGYFTSNFDVWPFSAQMIMLILMFIGGMSGSTAGGIKTSRFYIAYKILMHRLESIYRPDSIRRLYIGTQEVDEKNSLTVLTFFSIIAFFILIGTVMFVFDGVDPETSIGLVASLLNNVGIGFRAAGPIESMAFLSGFSKILATFLMLLGRLEFFVVLLLFLPTFWKRQ